MYTGPVATTDDFATIVQSEGSQPVEMSTIFTVLAEFVRWPETRGSERTLYIGLPKSLRVEERNQLTTDPHFRSLSPRKWTADQLESGVREIALQLLPNMSQQEQAEAICKGIVKYVADMFMLSESEVDENGSLSQYIDSLTATQLRNWLLATFRAALTGEDIADSPSIRVLADTVASRWRSSK